MKQVLQNMKTGEVGVKDIPPPSLHAGGILVRTHFSLISAGTEKTSVDTGKMSLLQKARSRPEDVKRVLAEIRQAGFLTTYKKVMTKLGALKPLGYSASGVVIAVDPAATGFKVGDRVACAGAGYASHADLMFVPKNLAARVPEGVALDEAAYTTVGSIALQGIRQAGPALGENVVVIGLGLVGLLAVQILKANGCGVVGVDVDPRNVELALRLGADLAVTRSENVKGIVESFTDGYGADAVVIAAGTRSSDPVVLAGDIARDRSRIVMIGATGMNIPRGPYYMKELELKLSRSYGPGRYDPGFEEKGNDYPIGYVRWTETRNMKEFLRLVRDKKVDVKSITTHRFHIDSAGSAYDLIAGKKKEPYVGILLEFDSDVPKGVAHLPGAAGHSKENQVVSATSFKDNPRAIGFIGAGSFAQANLLPALKGIGGLSLESVCTSTGVTAGTAQSQFGFRTMTTDSSEVLTDEKIGTVFIATRHNLHAPLVLQGLKAGKNVFVEKPLALSEEELIPIGQFFGASDESNRPLLMVGFNRRFAPLVEDVRKFFANVKEPLVVNYRVNAGYIPATHWTQDPVEGGGRIIGEVCHFVDLIQHLTGSMVEKVYAESISAGSQTIVDNDNVVITLRMRNGALGIITYIANGDSSLPKERIEISGAKSSAVIDNFQTAYLYRNGSVRKVGTGRLDKGIFNEVNAFIRAVTTDRHRLIPFDQLVNSALTTFRIRTSLSIGEPVNV